MFVFAKHESQYLVEQANVGKAEHEAELWHDRYGHISNKVLLSMIKSKSIEGIKTRLADIKLSCEHCVQGKLARKKFKSIPHEQSEEIGELTHSDIVGPMSTESIMGEFYFGTFYDDNSEHVVVYLLQKKNEINEAIKDYNSIIKNKTGKAMQRFRTDGGGEYNSKPLDEFYSQEGIKHEVTTKYSPQSNGKAERLNRTLLNSARTMLIRAKLPKMFWNEAIRAAAHIKNRTTTSNDTKQTPYQKWNQRKPKIGHLRVFGCLAYEKNVKPNSLKKFEPRAAPRIFMGYDQKQRAYRLYDVQNMKITVAREVKFFEDKSGFEAICGEQKDDEDQHQSKNLTKYATYEDEDDEDDAEEQTQQTTNNKRKAPANPETPPGTPPARTKFTKEIFSTPEQQQQADSIERSSSRIAKRSVKSDFGERRSARIARRLEDQLAETEFANVATLQDPRTIQEAMARDDADHWRQAIDEELNQLEQQETWSIVPIDKKKKNIISMKWVFKTKRNQNGDVERFKARLVARGFKQQYGIDYTETFTPTSRFESLRLLISISAKKDYTMMVTDIKGAYLKADLDKDIYCEQPPHYKKKRDNNTMLKLHKGLYGLKQSGWLWNRLFVKHISKMGFKQSNNETCLFINDVLETYLLIYVDDVLICAPNQKIAEEMIKNIEEEFEISKSENINTFLGIKITQTKDGIELHQQAYIEALLRDYEMEDANSKPTPVVITKQTNEEPCNKKKVPTTGGLSHVSTSMYTL